jgi:hypothetical protein
MLKTVKRLKHRRNKYVSFLIHERPTLCLPPPVTNRPAILETGHPPVLFFSPHDRETIAREALAAAPAACGKTITEADRLCRGTIDIFGAAVDIGGGIDWSCDFICGRTWPLKPAPQVPIVFAEDRSDIKVPWELARFQFLNTLGRAWSYTRETRYCHLARESIASFLAANPYGIGLHWTNPMEAAIRAANWIIADSFFKGADEWDDSFRREIQSALYDHGRFIRTHLERDGRGINNNHYTADLAGLFALGLYSYDSGEGARWLEFALGELDTEIDRQIAPDGMHYENSIGYHRLTFEMFYHTYRLGIANNIPAVRRWEPRLIKMAEFTLGMIMPNRRVPDFGDNDDGLWLTGTPRPPDDHRYLVGLSAATFGRPDPRLIDFPAEEIPEDIFWFAGPAAAQELRETITFAHTPHAEYTRTVQSSPPRAAIRHETRHARPTIMSQVFGSSGMIVLRSDTGAVLVSANPVGTGGIGGHKHNDLLSYVFTVGDHEIAVDPGTFTYTANPNLRNQLRSTGAHNTVMIDGAEQNRFYRRQLFWVRDDARPRICGCHLNRDIDRLTVEHDGYRRLRGTITHRRHFMFIKAENILVVRDELTGAGVHEINSVVNLGPGTINADDPYRVRLQPGDGGAQAGFLLEHLPGMGVGIEPGWRSVRYGHKTPLYRIVQRGRTQLPVRMTTIIGVFNQPVDWQRLAAVGEDIVEPAPNSFVQHAVRRQRLPVEVCL